MDIRKLVPFQAKGEDFLTAKGKGGVFMYMGYGKTGVTARTLMNLGCRKILIECPENALEVWKGDGAMWMRERLIELGRPPNVEVRIIDEESWNRAIDWNDPPKADCVTLYVAVYNTFARDMGVAALTKKGQPPKTYVPGIIKRFGFDAVVCDESRRLRNRKGIQWRATSQFLTQNGIVPFFPLTGTPTSKGPRHFWSSLNLLDRKKFSSEWAFINQFHYTERNPWGGIEIGPPKNLEQFHKLLAEYAWVVPEDDPEASAQLPKKRRQLINCKMDEDQERIYRELTEEMMSMVGDDVIIASNSMARFLRLRQILICPQILSPHLSVGGAIKDFVERCKDEELNPPYVIFTPFTAAFEPFKAYLHDKLTPHVFTMQGGMGHAAQAKAVEGWRHTAGVMLVSVEYAEAYSLEPARSSYFIGYHPDPNVNDQAESRLQRFTTPVSTMHNYYTYGTAIDHRMADIVCIKRDYRDWTVPANFRFLLKGQ